MRALPVAVAGQLDAAAAAIASTIAGRPVSVRCESDADWSARASGVGFEPTEVLEYAGACVFREG